MAGTIRELEDLVAFQKARRLAALVNQVCASSKLTEDAILRNQIRRAALSTVANVAEGFERDGNREFLNFLSIAKGSAGEIRAHAYMALDAHLISDSECKSLIAASKEFCSVTAGLMTYLRSTNVRGAKWKRESEPLPTVREEQQRYGQEAECHDRINAMPLEYFSQRSSATDG